MVHLLVVIQAILFFIGKAGGQVNISTLAELPIEIVEDFLVILGGGQFTGLVKCIDPNPSDIEMLLYTRNSPDNPVILNSTNPEKIDSNKKLILLIHGWIQDTNGFGIQDTKRAFLSRYDCNFVIVDWGRYSFDFYSHAVCIVPKIAGIVTNFLCFISKQSGIGLGTVQVIGHSLGGQMSGFIGQLSRATCQQTIGEITGLDPAGILYTNAPIDHRLDETDAEFVFVMHTNGGFIGYLTNCGDVDFYVNCGSVQPGCLIPKIDLNNLFNSFIGYVGCSHFRALYLLAESVNTNKFQAIPCGGCPLFCPPITNIFQPKIAMGESTPSNARGGYYVLTNCKPPYAIGLPFGL